MVVSNSVSFCFSTGFSGSVGLRQRKEATHLSVNHTKCGEDADLWQQINPGQTWWQLITSIIILITKSDTKSDTDPGLLPVTGLY